MEFYCELWLISVTYVIHSVTDILLYSIYIIRPLRTVVPRGLMFYNRCFFFFSFRHRISELRRPIAMKLYHIIDIWLNFVTQVQKFGVPSLKNFGGQKYAKFGPILHNFRL